MTSHDDSRDDGLIGVLAVAGELFPGWLWACAVDEGEERRLVQSSPLPVRAVAGFEHWGQDLLERGTGSAPKGVADAIGSKAVEVRSFVVEDPALRTVAIMGCGPSGAVAPESDVILDAVARNLKVFEEGRRAA